jgi:hypothetical protein
LGSQFSIFFDAGANAGNFPLAGLTKAARNSAVFIGIGSPAYTERPWLAKELGAFQEVCRDDDRLFLVEYLSLDGRRYPPPMDGKIAARFWLKREFTDTAVPLSESEPSFYDLILDLAKAVERQLRALRVDPVFTTQPATFAKRILVAQGTADVESSIEDLQRHLAQYPEYVAARAPIYPQGGREFCESFENDLKSSDIVVQLLGNRPDKKPPDLPQGYTRYQFDTAREAGKTVLQWRHPQIILGEVADPDYRAMLEAPEATVCGFEEFKALVVRAAQKKEVDELSAGFEIFITADRLNIEPAKSIGREFELKNFKVAMPAQGPSIEENRRHLFLNLRQCGCIVFVHGLDDLAWLTTQRNVLDSQIKLRASPPGRVAVCTVPPGEKPDRDFMGRDFDDIDCSAEFDIKKVRQFVDELARHTGEPDALIGTVS